MLIFKGFSWRLTFSVAMFFSFVNHNLLTANDVNWTNSGTGSWTSGSNWDIDGFSIPGAFFEDVAIINNGGTATFNSVSLLDAAGLTLGYELDGAGVPINPGSGALIIQSGELSFVSTAGASTNFPPIGKVNVGFEGGTGGEGDSGLLEVQGGGTLNVNIFDINQNGVLRIGTGTGSATVSSEGDLFSNGTIEVHGPGHSISIGGSLFFEQPAQGVSRFVPHITASGASVVGVAGTANLGGSIMPVFDGVTPQLGDSWDLIDAQSVQGVSEVVASASAGTAYRASVVEGGAGQILRLSYDAFATLKVDADTGHMSLVSESGDPINMVGYQIFAAGPSQFATANWNSLADQSGTYPGWEEAAGTTGALAELNSENSLALSTTPISLGSNLFVPPSEFGVAPGAVTFQYGVAGETDPVTGIVEVTGDAAINNLLLTVDPTTGEAQLKNSSAFTIDLIGYQIASASGALNEAGWDSLENQGVSGWDDGQEEPTANNAFSLAELVPEDPAATLSPGQAFLLGDIFQTGANQDLSLQFALVVESTPGDYNNDQVVDAADYAVWRNSLGQSVALPNETVTPGVVTIEDYDEWRSHYGATGVAGQTQVLQGVVQYGALPAMGAGVGAALAPAPEPSSLLIALAGAAALGLVRVRSCRRVRPGGSHGEFALAPYR